MTTMQKIVDAIQDVTARVQHAIDAGERSREIDADDLVEVLLAIAERLDPGETAELSDDVLLDELVAIAKTELRVPTLDSRGNDSLDFHEVGVAGLRDALIRAYRLGRDSHKP
jgi:hypothetical protein